MSDNKSIPLPSRDSVTALQVNTLLSIAGTLNGMLFHLNDEEQTEGGRNDGGVKSSIETTLIGTCSRLDAVLADRDRWSMKGQGQLEKQLSLVYEANLRFLKLQTQTVMAVNKPHRRYSPTLVQLDGGQWAAVLGDINTANAIVGSGMSPDQAMEDFDKVFLGKVKNSVIVQTEEIKTNNEHHLDPRTIEPTEDSPEGGQDQRPSGEDNAPE